MDLKSIAWCALDEALAFDASYFDGVKRFMVKQPGNRKGEADNSIASHDRKYHPNGYEQGGLCKYRENLEKGSDADRLDDDVGVGLPKGVSVEACDITKQPVDAIVNAANRWMLGGGGVDGAIHRAAGPSLVEECSRYPADENGFRVQTGEAKITGAGNLPARHVIHTAGPDVREFVRRQGNGNGFYGFGSASDWDLISDDDRKELRSLLSNSYKNSLQVAKDNGCRSVAFPSISTGIFGYPVEEAAPVVAETVSGFLKDNPEMSVKMCIFDPNPAKQEATIRAYEKAFSSVKGHDEDVAMDADDAAVGGESMTDLQKHDAKYHPDGYKPGDACKYRANRDKVDRADMLNPEEVEGDTDGAEAAANGNQAVPQAFSTAEKDVNDAIKDVEGGDLSGVQDLANKLDAYEKEYGNVSAGSSSVKVIGGLLSKCKSQTGMMAQIYQRHMNALKATAAATSLPKGTLTPQDMRNKAAGAVATALGAQLTAGSAATRSSGSKASQQPPSASSQKQNGSRSANQKVTAAAQTQQTQPTAQPQAAMTLGPNASLPHNFTALPAGMNLNDFAKWPRGGGSTGLRIYTDPTTGKKYGVKKSDGMPNGEVIPKDVLIEDYLADQALRLAGLDAPDGLLQMNPGDGCVYKVTEWHDNASGIGLGGGKTSAQLAEAYPMMSLLYNMDASQHGDNILVDNATGKLVFVDNGSSFGNRAQGKSISWYDSRINADSTKDAYGVAQLASHSSQGMWASALGTSGMKYGAVVGQAEQDKILKQFAKYDMGGITGEIAKMRNAQYANLGIPRPTKRDKKFANMDLWAKSADALSAKFKSASPAGKAAQPAAASAPVAQTTHQGNINLSSQNLTSLPQQPRNVTGDFNCAVNALTSLQGAPKTVGGYFSCSNNQLTSLQGAPQSVVGDFNCADNQLTSLQGAPQTVGGDFWCSGNQLTSLQGAPQSVGGDFSCAGNQLTSLDGAPVKVGGGVYFTYNPGLTAKQIQDYKDFLKNPDPAHIDATGHYSEKAIQKSAGAQQPSSLSAPAQTQPSAANAAGTSGSSIKNITTGINPSWTTPGRAQRNGTTIRNAVMNMNGLTPASVAVLTQMFNGKFTPNGRGVGGTVTGLSIPSNGRYSIQANLNAAFASQGLKIQIHNGGNTVSIGASNKSIASQALAATGNAVSGAQQTGGQTPVQQSTSNASAPTGNQTPQPQTQTQQTAQPWTTASAITSSPNTHSSWTTSGNVSNQSRNARGIIAAMASVPISNTQVSGAFANMLGGTFIANGRGVGGQITGCSISSRGIQSLGKAINAHMNPLGFKVQIHNGGKAVTISATNRNIANQALSATGNQVAKPTQQPATSPAPSQASAPAGISTAQASPAAQTQAAAPSTGSTQTSSQAGNAGTPSAGGASRAWQSAVNSAVGGTASNQIKNAYNGIATWLNNAGV